jgi:hypothetical protein
MQFSRVKSYNSMLRLLVGISSNRAVDSLAIGIDNHREKVVLCFCFFTDGIQRLLAMRLNNKSTTTIISQIRVENHETNNNQNNNKLDSRTIGIDVRRRRRSAAAVAMRRSPTTSTPPVAAEE